MTTQAGAQATLADVVAALGGHLRDVVEPRGGLAVPVRGVTLVDAVKPAEIPADFVGLVLGARPNDLRPIVQAAERAGAAALIFPSDGKQGVPDLTWVEPPEVALLSLRSTTSWDQVRDLTAAAVAAAAELPPSDDGALFALARTLLATTGGSVSIEDSAHRVLAYAAVPGEADVLRVHSILGREGPEDLLEILRSRGVYERLRVPGAIVNVPPDDVLGWSARIAAGIFAGDQHLGTIWIQQGARPLARHTDTALIGAARLAAYELEGSRIRARSRSEVLRDALLQRTEPSLAATELRIRTSRQVMLASVTVKQEPTGPTRELAWRGRLAGRLELWAASCKREAVVAVVGSTMYLLLPEANKDDVNDFERSLERLSRELKLDLVVGVSSERSLAELQKLRQEADSSRELGQSRDHRFSRYSEVRSHLMLNEVVRVARDGGLLEHPGLERLFGPDGSMTDQGTTLLLMLELEGDVAEVATRLQVHVNTVRYRLKRAAHAALVDLASPDDRLLVRLALRAQSGRTVDPLNP